MAEIRQIQVDGVNYDLVISEDEVSATAAAQSAAQALAYKNQAQSSAAQAGQQATNASNQADRAEDAASRAEQIVGGEFLSYGGDQGLDFDQQDQARENIGKATFKSASGSLVNIEHAANIPLQTLTANIVPIQAGSGDPSPSNVRTISGWTGAKVFTGGNTAICTDTTLVELPVPIQPGQTYGYYLPVYPYAATSEQARYLSLYGPNREFLEWWTGGASEITKVSSFSVPVTYIGFRLESNPDVPRVGAIRNISAGQSYDVTTYEITFPSSAGTVYGGSLNVKTGVLTVTHNYILIGNQTIGKYTAWGSENVFSFTPNPSVIQSAAVIGNTYMTHFSEASQNDVLGGRVNGFYVRQDTAQIYISALDYTDASAFKTAFQDCAIVYPLATPITYQCTPTEVTALLGLNNIWADTGDVSLEYLEQGVLTEEYAKYEEERIPLVTARMFTNPNLFDNSWFRVNQMQVTSGQGNQGYIADRWQMTYGNGGVTYSRTDDTVTVQSTNGVSHGDIFQILESNLWNFLNRKTVTLSVMLNDYSIRSATFKFDSTATKRGALQYGLDGNAMSYECNLAARSVQIWKYYTSETYRAAKLELGTISTLANDTPLNYAEELTKCQRYFWRLCGAQYLNIVSAAVAESSAAIFGVCRFPVPMRAMPSVSTSGAIVAWSGISTTTQSIPVTLSRNDNSSPTTNPTFVGIKATGSGFTVGQRYDIQIRNDASGYVDFSANLQ